MNVIQGNIYDFYRSCPIVNAVRTQLVGVQYLLDLQMTNEVNIVRIMMEGSQKFKNVENEL